MKAHRQTLAVAKKEFAEKVRVVLNRRLEDLEWGWADLRRATGLPRTTMHHVEHAQNDPNIATLVAISEVVRLTLDELIGRSVPEAPGISKRQAEILTAYRHRDDVRSIIDTLVPRKDKE